jgi:segregation and condensation protein B
VPGKPSLYGTTREFLDYFGLKALDALPTLAELRDLDEINRELDLSDPDRPDASNDSAAGTEPETQTVVSDGDDNGVVSEDGVIDNDDGVRAMVAGDHTGEPAATGLPPVAVPVDDTAAGQPTPVVVPEEGSQALGDSAAETDSDAAEQLNKHEA